MRKLLRFCLWNPLECSKTANLYICMYIYPVKNLLRLLQLAGRFHHFEAKKSESVSVPVDL